MLGEKKTHIQVGREVEREVSPSPTNLGEISPRKSEIPILFIF